MEFVWLMGRMLASVTGNVFQKKMSHRGLSPLYITLGGYLMLSLIRCLAKFTFPKFKSIFG